MLRYPLAFVGLKSSVLALLNKGWASTETQEAAVTVGLLLGITAAALVLKDLGFVAALTGSLMGSLIIYIYPALFRLKSLRAIKKDEALSVLDKLSTYGLISTGAVLGIVGVTVSILKQTTALLG